MCLKLKRRRNLLNTVWNEECLNCDYRVCVFANVCVVISRLNCREIHAYNRKE